MWNKYFKWEIKNSNQHEQKPQKVNELREEIIENAKFTLVKTLQIAKNEKIELSFNKDK